MSYLRCLCLLAYSGVQHMLWCVFVLLFFVFCTLCCQFLWIVHFWLLLRYSLTFIFYLRGRRWRNRMVVGFTTTYAIRAYHHWCCEFESLSGRGVQHYVIKFVAKGRWFSPGTPVSSTNKNDRHNITEILLKVALNTIKQT